MSTDVKLITWMVPVTYENGYGFTTLVNLRDCWTPERHRGER